MELSLNVKKSLGTFTLDADFSTVHDRVGLFGVSGSGKSTLVRIIAGLQRPDSGLIELDGEILFNGAVNLPPARRRIGIIFQHPHLFPHLNVRSNLLYGYNRCAAVKRLIDVDSLVDVLGIGHLLDRGVNNLSGGEQQRVAIGRAVLSNPRLLLMDEPLSALDDNLRYQIISYLKAVCATFKIPYIFISHSTMEMRLMVDQVIDISTGRITGQTTVEEFARARMGQSAAGYINMLELKNVTQRGDMCAFHWDGGELLLSGGSCRNSDGVFELSSKDIMLFKKHPEAISARNLLACTVSGLFTSGTKLGVELVCGEGRLIAEIVHDAANELGIEKGSTVYAAIKASAFRKID